MSIKQKSVGPDAAQPEGPALEAAVATARAAYVAANPASRDRYQTAARVMPGGNTRTVLFYEPFPLCILRGEGARLWDADGHAYRDLLGEFTAAIYGHSHPTIRAAIDAALDDGINLSGHNRLEAELAGIVCARFPSIEQVRFANSGTEANLLALAAAIAHTGRRKILVFKGAYHGGVLVFGAAPAPVTVPHDFVMAPYNDLAGTLATIETHAGELAAILVEPMLGAGGCIPGDPAFLAGLRDAATKHGIVLIFDEVMTSRLSPGGRQALLGIVPDMTTLGKYIGGGSSFGAFGGRAEIMAHFDPRRPNALSHAGTFNNNVVSMAAGIAGMTEVLTPAALETLNARGDALREALNALFRRRGARLQVTGLGSIMNLHATGAPIRSPADLAGADPLVKDLLFFDLIARGFYLARRGLIALSLPLTDTDTAALVAAFDDILSARGALLI
ncbi:MAG: aminotransferase class III-fold pyridoxal phosphate-dependent enzyme [Rhodospirillaceae bacterium]|nr:aminotransferase class III-fold pyridoxal phosphate-dependent enzyme [Rhodospirillaceae bacterium]